MIRLEDKGRKYKRYRPSSDEKIQLADKGLQWVLSSNVSAVGVKDDDLIIRFQNGSLYRYSKVGNKLNSILNSNSKGHWVWVHLRRKNVPYKKIGSIRFESDAAISDEDLFENIRTDAIRVESPQVLDIRDVQKKPSILKLAATILVLNDIPGIEILPVNILNNIRQM